MKRVTIKEVAREAGVSISTVSNALNGVDVLTPETKAHVLEVAERLHYVPNLNGRNLKMKETKTIGLFVDTMGGSYYGELVDTIYSVCDKYGYELHVFIAKNTMSLMANVYGKRVDGAIFLNELLTETHRDTLQKAGIPMVFLDREWIGDKMSSVVFDSYQAGYDAAKYLLSLGTDKIGFVSGNVASYDAMERNRGFMDGLNEAGVSLNPNWKWYGQFHRHKTRALFDKYMTEEYASKGLPDVIFAANDDSAIGCIETLQKHGIKVPEQVKVMGCDDRELSKWFVPKLTTIRTSMRKQGELAGEIMIQMLKDGSEGQLMKLPCAIVERESTKD